MKRAAAFILAATLGACVLTACSSMDMTNKSRMMPDTEPSRYTLPTEDMITQATDGAWEDNSIMPRSPIPGIKR